MQVRAGSAEGDHADVDGTAPDVGFPEVVEHAPNTIVEYVDLVRGFVHAAADIRQDEHG
ncbi:hypothetical protein [Embleya sp. NPDC059237]|uniref:hypothetical protein n=1 Tax=Embleya sp. NPDC059237 TaxID=3346784 RepID=UPI00368E8CB0